MASRTASVGLLVCRVGCLVIAPLEFTFRGNEKSKNSMRQRELLQLRSRSWSQDSNVTEGSLMSEEENQHPPESPRKKPNLLAVGIALGAAVGAGIGAAMGNVGIGIAIGIAIGAALGSALSRKNR